MSSFQNLRRQTARRPRRVIGLLALAWLSVVVQPCAMAFGAAPAADCPHCPADAHGPAAPGGHHAADHAAGHGHGGGHAASEAAAAPACDSLLSDCYVLSDAQFDSRSAAAKTKYSPLELPALPPSLDLSYSGRAVYRGAACRPAPAPPGVSRPLSVLYCVYRK